MGFAQLVQNKQVTWPTQKRFSKDNWLELATKESQGARDDALAGAGLWVYDTLDGIRRGVGDLSFWNLSFQEVARYSLALCNHDFVLARKKTQQVFANMDAVPMVFADEILHGAAGQDLIGVKRISDLLNSGIDAAELCMQMVRGSRKSKIKPDISDLVQALNFAVLYKGTEDVFYRCLWLDWQIRKIGDSWIITPTEVENETRWEASYRRFEQLIAEFYSSSQTIWEHDSFIREAWLHKTKGVPRFNIVPDSGGVLRVIFASRDKTVPDAPPQDFIYEIMAREAYSEPLLMEPLPNLDGKNVLELLQVQFMLGSVLDQVIDEYLLAIRDSADTALEYCPLILLDPLTSALSKALRVSTETVVTLVDALTVSDNTIGSRSIWFHPLVRTRTKKGDAVMPVFLPLLATNVYRDVDYWLTTFGLPLEKRGRLFEQQLADSLRVAAEDSEMHDHVVVRNSVELSSEEEPSEEIDLVLLLHDLVVIGEAKCMKLPVTPVERKNYLETLRGAAAQATRKAAWAERNIASVAQSLGVEVTCLSGRVQPVVISNHSPGVGYKLAEVPIVDLRLITNYLARPYDSAAIYSTSGYAESRRSTFYSTPEEMARNFRRYMEVPPPLEIYRTLLKPSFLELPLRSAEQVLFLAYSMDPSIMANSVAQVTND